MSLPMTCVKDAFFYGHVVGPRGLVSPVPHLEGAISLADLPHGAFSRMVRGKIDPLWGAQDLDPEGLQDLTDLFAERGWAWEAETLWNFQPGARVNRLARAAYESKSEGGKTKPRMQSVMDALYSHFAGDDPIDEEDRAAERAGEDAPTAELTAAVESIAAAIAQPAPAAPTPEVSPPPNAVPLRPAYFAAPASPEPATPNGTNTNGLAKEIAPQPATPKDSRMQFTADKAPLLAALRKAAGLVPKKTTMPILSHILLDVGNDLTISGTDLAVDVQVRMSVSMGATPGKVAAPGADLVSAISTLPDGAQVTLERTEDGRLRILSGRTRFHLPIRQPDEMPAFAEADGHEIRAQAQEWRKAIDRVAFAIATDEVVKAQLCGLFLHARREGLRAVGMNGNLLSRSDLAVTAPARAYVAAYEETDGPPGILIPRESVGILRRLLGDAGDTQEVVATVNTKRAVFDLGPVRFGTTLSAAQFPPYEAMIDHNHQGAERKLAVPRADFLAVVNRVQTLATDKYRAVTLTVTAEGIRVAVSGDSGADAVDILEVPTRYEDGTLQIGFNAGMLVAGLQSMGDPALLCDLSGPNGPTFWRAIQEEDIAAAEHLVIVLPCRVSAPVEGV
ncbi:DNA polymerase III subunit beta [Azospirillum doebereinerae]|uniref:Beta sliding clamp n=1 Tax=Azospirillum doebereinerae TaxID=92933 RepID=A0A433IZP9_9PROT|nr:DNA polymerase III subunit beta [Azospirillum doebereinerae]RUQ61244.1 DNA polymerase III subunit beta [Azospirillum doebereinerae]